VKDNDIHGSILSSVNCGSIDNFDAYQFMWNTWLCKGLNLLFFFYYIYFSYITSNPITLDPSLASTNGNVLFLLSNMATSEILSSA
jgi:hypothetical protein